MVFQIQKNGKLKKRGQEVLVFTFPCRSKPFFVTVSSNRFTKFMKVEKMHQLQVSLVSGGGGGGNLLLPYLQSMYILGSVHICSN